MSGVFHEGSEESSVDYIMFSSLIFYNTILFSSTFFIWLSEKCSTLNQRRICTIIAFFIVFLPSAFRYEVGIDYFSYRMMFEDIRDGLEPFLQSKIEPGYYFLNWLIVQMGLSFEWLVGLIALITFSLFFYSYPKKYRAYFHFAFVAMIYFSANNLLRNWLALGFIWVAIFNYINKRDLLKYVVLVVVGALFHKSSFVFLFLPLVSKINFFKISQTTNVLFGMFLLSMLLWGEGFIRFILSSELSSFLGYSRYANSWFSKDTELETGLGVLFKVLFLFYSYFWMRDSHHLSNQNKDFFILIVSATLFSTISASLVHVFGRLNHLFVIGYFLVLLFYLSNENIMFSRLASWAFLIFLFLNYNKVILNGSTDYMETCRGARITPYISIFNKGDSNRDAYLTRHTRWCESYFQNN